MTASPKRIPTRERILAAAERLFALTGFDRVSMPEIAKAAGITAGAIYRHFESKDDLFFEIVKRAVEAAPQPGGQVDGDAAASLPAAISRFTAPDLKLVRRLAVEMHYASPQHPKIRKLLRASLEAQVDDMRHAIAAHGDEPDAALQAQALMVFVMGLMHMETLAPHLVGDETWRRTVERSVTALIGGR